MPKKYRLFVVRETKSAVLVGHHDRVWLPLSQVKRTKLGNGWELFTVEDDLAEALDLRSISNDRRR